ncbi:MAG: hypothetical protein R3B09_03055 [Nannocystaceae bacterium]
MKITTTALFILGLAGAFTIGASPASAGTCEDQCRAALQECLSDGSTPKSVCLFERNECLADCP